MSTWQDRRLAHVLPQQKAERAAREAEQAREQEEWKAENARIRAECPAGLKAKLAKLPPIPATHPVRSRLPGLVIAMTCE